MQVNEFVRQVQQGTRLTDMDMHRAFIEPRRTGTKRSEGVGSNLDSRQAVAGTTRMPRRYGAGF